MSTMLHALRRALVGTGSTAFTLIGGVLVSYWGLLLVASWLRARIGVDEQDAQRYRRAAWNRSMRDSRYRPGTSRSDPIERLFVATAIVSILGFAIWFAFFAGAPF